MLIIALLDDLWLYHSRLSPIPEGICNFSRLGLSLWLEREAEVGRTRDSNSKTSSRQCDRAYHGTRLLILLPTSTSKHDAPNVGGDSA